MELPANIHARGAHAAAGEIHPARERNPWRERLLTAGFVLSVALSVVLIVLFAMLAAENRAQIFGASPVGTVLLVAAFVLLSADIAGCIGIMVLGFRTHGKAARMLARVTLGCLVATVVTHILIAGVQAYLLIYAYQFLCITAYQTYTDEAIARNEKFLMPWEVDADPARKAYIPLNFFNIFWVFVVACIVGLVVEILYRAIVVGAYESRAGLLWGPFSPIYGVGGLLMTIALNRWWNRNALVIFAVSAVIGGAFEYAASWFWETGFGIVAWDYSNNLLNIGGRTDFAHLCAWGLLGLMWIRILLPALLRAVDMIPVRWRIAITTAFALFMFVDIAMTMLALDSWYERAAGNEPSNFVQVYCAEHFDDEFMAERFATMSIDPSRASRVGSPEM